MVDATAGGAATARSAEAPGRARDRRARPRVPADLPVLITAGPTVVVGTTVNASEAGLAVSIPASTPALPAMVRIALRLPQTGWHEIDGEVVRRHAPQADGGSVILGIRLAHHAPDSPPPAVLPPRRRAPEPGQARQAPFAPARAVGADVRALASLVYEQAFHDPGGRPLPALLAWANRLAAALGLIACAPASNRELLSMVAALHRRWSAPVTRAPGVPAPRLSGRPLSPRR